MSNFIIFSCNLFFENGSLVDDAVTITITIKADQVRRELMLECSKCGPEAAAEALGIKRAEDKGQLQ